MFGFIHEALRQYILEKYSTKTWDAVIDKAGFQKGSENIEHHHYHDDDTGALTDAIIEIIGVASDQFWEEFGAFFLDFVCRQGWEALLRSMSPDIANFFNGLDSWHNFISFAIYKSNMKGPSFRCENSDNDSVLLHYYTSRHGIHPMVKGAVHKLASKFFGFEVNVTLMDVNRYTIHYEDGLCLEEHVIYRIQKVQKSQDLAQPSLWTKPVEVIEGIDGILQVNKKDFLSLQPYHFIADRDCNLIQCGKGLLDHISIELLEPGTPLNRIFDIVRPHICFDFDTICDFINAIFVLELRTTEMGDIEKQRRGSACSTLNQDKNLKLKGQMIVLDEGKRLLYMASPCISTVPELLGCGMRLQAMPLHDVTRDLILINQQRLSDVETNVQLEANNAAMEKLNRDLEEEKAKTEALLREMLPAFVAAQLINGKTVDACEYPEATVMFSDVPNFQNIVTRCKPRQIVKLLNELFTKLDHLVTRHAVYKVETIGDSYMTVGGVPQQIDDHCEILCHLALGMLFEALSVTDPITRKPLQIRLGINSGPIVAGVIGKKMPRYCLFGDTVNTASRMESHGVPGKIHCSKAAFESAQKTGKFVFEYRGTVLIKGKGQMETYFLKSSAKKSIWEITGIERDPTINSIDGYAELEEGLGQQNDDTKKKHCQICTAL